MKLPTKLSSLVFAAALLAACGGGGGPQPTSQPLAAGVLAQDVSQPTPTASYGACTGLLQATVPGVTISVAESVTSGAWTLADGTVLEGLPAFCRVEGITSPTPGAQIGFELWIPQPNAWNGKYMQVGVIAYAGSYEYRALANMLQRGYATAATDAGHKGTTANAAWALGAPGKIADWGWRAHPAVAAAAKALLQAFAGRAPDRSYFFGASTGGRDALSMAQRRPQDFDGYIVDAAALQWTRLAASWTWSVQALFSQPGSWIPPSKLPAIQAAVLAQCDGIDGLVDGLVTDPRRCHFDASVLQCKLLDGDDCLTPPQTNALRKLYTGAVSPATGQRIFSGYELAAATDANFITYILGADPLVPTSGMALLGNTFWANMVQDSGDALFDFRAWDMDRDVALAESKPLLDGTLASAINAMNPDLAAARDRGARILMYHGWEDPIVPARIAIDYYERVVAAQISGKDKGEAALQRTREFFRLFLVPGMSHLNGGTGTDALGSPYGPPALRMEPGYDVVRTLEAWVEQGAAPDRIVAARYVAGSTPAAGVARTRPVCAYPQIARYAGSGSIDEAASFACAEAPRGAYLD